MFLVMDMNFSMLLKTSHASPGDGGGTFGLGIISGLLIYASAEIFKKFFIFLLHFRYDEFRFFQKWIN